MLAAWGLFVGLQALYNHTQFGAINLSGYALSGEQDGFSLAYFTRHFGLVMGGLNREFLPVIFPLGLVGLALWGSPTDRAVRLLWFVPVLITYTSYYWVNDNWSCLRFFMSTLPVCIGSAYAVLEQMPASRVARTGAALMVLGLFVTLNAAGVWNMVQGEPLGHNPRELARVAGKLASQTPANAVIFSRAPLGLSMGPRAAYTVYDLDAFRRGHGLARFREIDPRARESEPRQQAERTRRLREFYERTTDQGLLESERTIVQASLEAGRPVFFLVPVYQCDQEKQRLGPGGTWKTVEEWDVDWSSAGYLHRERWGLYRIGPRARAGPRFDLKGDPPRMIPPTLLGGFFLGLFRFPLLLHGHEGGFLHVFLRVAFLGHGDSSKCGSSLTDQKSSFGWYGHAPVATVLNVRFLVVRMPKRGWKSKARQKERAPGRTWL